MLQLPDILTLHWVLLGVAAMGIGVSKSGLSGLSMLHVIIFAHVFGARDSTGVVLPMLIVGDICAMKMYGMHTNWILVKKMFWPAAVGVIVGWVLMFWLQEWVYKPLIGVIILSLCLVQVVRLIKESWFAAVPHQVWFAVTMGTLVGVTTMLANAAGPIFGLYLLAIACPKMEFVGTSAWFFLILNVFKLPFSWSLGLIRVDTLLLNAVLVPFIFLGIYIGRWVVTRVSQRVFNILVLLFTAIAAVRLCLS